jgi:hypothetical protein
MANGDPVNKAVPEGDRIVTIVLIAVVLFAAGCFAVALFL